MCRPREEGQLPQACQSLHWLLTSPSILLPARGAQTLLLPTKITVCPCSAHEKGLGWPLSHLKKLFVTFCSRGISFEVMFCSGVPGKRNVCVWQGRECRVRGFPQGCRSCWARHGCAALCWGLLGSGVQNLPTTALPQTGTDLWLLAHQWELMSWCKTAREGKIKVQLPILWQSVGWMKLRQRVVHVYFSLTSCIA